MKGYKIMKIVNRKKIEEVLLKEGGSLLVDKIDWKIKLMDRRRNEIGVIRFDTFNNIKSSSLKEIGFDIDWMREYEVMEGVSNIWF